MKTYPRIKTVSLVLLTFFITKFTAAQTFINIEELDISSAQQNYGSAAKNTSVVGETISVAGATYKNGIGVHAHSVIKLKLNNSRHFTCKVGVNDNSIDYAAPEVKSIPLTDGTRMFYKVTDDSKQFIGVEGNNGKVDAGSVVFRLVHNGKEVYNSGIMRQGDALKQIDLP